MVWKKMEKHALEVHNSKNAMNYAYVEDRSVINYLHFAFVPEINPLYYPQ